MGPAILRHLQPVQLGGLFGGEQVPSTRLSGPSTRLRTIICASIPTATATAITTAADTALTIGSLLRTDRARAGPPRVTVG